MLGLEALRSLRQQRQPRIGSLLDLDPPHSRRDGKCDFLAPALRALGGLSDVTTVVDNASSANPYDVESVEIIRRRCQGIILGCGAGEQPTRYRNDMTVEIVDYRTTDVIAASKRIPRKPLRRGPFDDHAGPRPGSVSSGIRDHDPGP